MASERELVAALATLGDVLEERGHHFAVLIAGGTSLLLLGLVSRPTADVDVLGVVASGAYVKAERLPPPLDEAVRDVGDALGLAPNWVNVGPAGLLDLGLPPGLEARVAVRRFGGLEVHLPARLDVICFKVYAAADQGLRSKHFDDLKRIAPTEDELRFAARWARTHDPSEGFLQELRHVLDGLGTGGDVVLD